MRSLPYGLARARRRAARRPLSRDAGPRDRRPRAAVGGDDVPFAIGERVGVPWLGFTCGECRDCKLGLENLCERAGFTGCTLDGGYAEHAIADARYCFRVPDRYDDAHAAPLLCAGLIGYRAYKAAGDGRNLDSTASARPRTCSRSSRGLQGRRVFAFTRRGDDAAQRFALELGAVWTGDSESVPPEELDAAILSLPSARSYPPRSRRRARAAAWSAPAST